MNSVGIKWAALFVLAVSFLGFFFGGRLPIPLMAKFFLGAFGFGTGAVLLIVSNILKIKEYESTDPGHNEDSSEPDAETEDEE